jgi:hypothetical protein
MNSGKTPNEIIQELRRNRRSNISVKKADPNHKKREYNPNFNNRKNRYNNFDRKFNNDKVRKNGTQIRKRGVIFIFYFRNSENFLNLNYGIQHLKITLDFIFQT